VKNVLDHAVLTLSIALWLGAAPMPAAAQKTFGDTADVVVVEIPATVTRDGQPVRDLTAENFEVLDGRKKQKIIGFEVVDLSITPAATAPLGAPQSLPTAARRHFLFLFDLSFSDPTAVVRAREAAQEVARQGLHPQDLAAVATWSTLQGPRLILGFTPDRKQLALALETLGNPKLAKGARDPLGLVFADLQAFSQGFGTTEGQSEARGERDAAVQEYLEDIAGMVITADRAEQKNRINAMARQMADLARLLDTVEGRKYVVYLSEGFDDSLLVGAGGDARMGASGARQGIGDASIGGSPSGTASDAILSGQAYDVDSDAVYGSGQVQNDLQAMLQEFRKANCTIQAVDIGGLRAAGGVAVTSVSGQNVLSQMASETGGEVFRNFNDLGEALELLVEKTSVTYLLAIQPDKLERDGKYHPLRVRLKDVPRGTAIYHRPGYYAPLPLKEQSGLQRQLATASELMGEAGGALETAVLATPVRPDEGRAYVPLMIEVEGQTLAAGTSGDVLPVEIYAYALDADGAVHDFFTQTLPIDLKQAGAQLAASGLKYFGHLDLAPGDYTVRVLVRNLVTGLSNLSVFPLSVPDFAAGAPTLSRPLFPEPMGKWVMVTEEQARRRAVPYPFMLGEQPFIPAAAPVIARKGETRIPLLAYNLGEGELTVFCRLLGADGKEASGVEVSKVERLAGASPGTSALVVHLTHAGLSPGTYTLEVEVSGAGAGAGKPLTTSAPVTVEGRG